MTEKRTPFQSFRIGVETREKLNRMRDVYGVSISEILRRALDAFDYEEDLERRKREGRVS